MQHSYLTAFVFAFLSIRAAAQDVSSVIRAERSFAAHAVQHGVRSAFLAYTDSTAVAMDNGQYENALAQWRQRPESDIQLIWGPQYAGASGDGASGFTTGPYYMKHPGTDTLLLAGQYTTFWVRGLSGDWKYLIDFGIRFPKRLYADPPPNPITVSLTPDPQATPNKAEETFLQNYRTAGKAAYEGVLDEHSWLNLERHVPVSKADRFLELIGRMPVAPEFRPVGSFLSAAKDLAYVYGDVLYVGRKAHYLRIWGHSPAGWKVLVQVMH
ncbi:hypothetical protein [Chitinophaga rhizosphaerae]|uniref:hypothetical protein n=1 Tax=Chitinophaga rhizosphaerae TaxID=1864947 RepID=UPI000F80447A|nr:hypothetical protein [Chitinophaga rhizosphaerae]